MPSARIRVLSDHTINLVAAGEVIKDPSSVVKELVDNAIDAQAGEILIEIKEGGRHLIRVSDNGHGMLCDDALLSLERHATSKIQAIEDLQELDTMGFRGEALPSIAAISKFTLLTAPENNPSAQSEAATLIRVEGGKILACHNAHRSKGTTVEVQALFFNVPVRRKFQKSPHFDAAEITQMIRLLALANPSIQFELVSDQKSIIKTTTPSSNSSFAQSLTLRMQSIFGLEYTESLLPVEFKKDDLQIYGFIGSPATHKPNKRSQHLFINRRPVTSSLIANSVREGYATMLPVQRFPLFMLHICMPGPMVDVNVHPQKKEVRLRNEQQIKNSVIAAIQYALRQKQFTTPLSVIDQPILENITPFWGAENFGLQSTNGPSNQAWSVKQNSLACEMLVNQAMPLKLNISDFIGQVEQVEKERQGDFYHASTPHPLVLATIPGFCLLDGSNIWQLSSSGSKMGENGFAILDQQAAYARIHYDKLVQSACTKTASVETQSLLIPLPLTLAPNEISVVRRHANLLQQMGFELREFDANTMLLDTFPSFMHDEQLAQSLNQIIQILIDDDLDDEQILESQRQQKIALSVCRNLTIWPSKRLSVQEGQLLVKQLLLCNLPALCPFGKPTCLYFSSQEINKWFKKFI